MSIGDLHVTVDNADYTFLTEREIGAIRVIGQHLLTQDTSDYTTFEMGKMLCVLTRDIEELHVLASILRAKAAYPKRSLD